MLKKNVGKTLKNEKRTQSACSSKGRLYHQARTVTVPTNTQKVGRDTYWLLPARWWTRKAAKPYHRQNKQSVFLYKVRRFETCHPSKVQRTPAGLETYNSIEGSSLWGADLCSRPELSLEQMGHLLQNGPCKPSHCQNIVDLCPKFGLD